jgi:hypothetical protein
MRQMFNALAGLVICLAPTAAHAGGNGGDRFAAGADDLGIPVVKRSGGGAGSVAELNQLFKVDGVRIAARAEQADDRLFATGQDAVPVIGNETVQSASAAAPTAIPLPPTWEMGGVGLAIAFGIVTLENRRRGKSNSRVLSFV